MAINIAVIGTGMMGSAHIRNLKDVPGAKLTCICDADTDTAERTANQNSCRAEVDPMHTIASDDVDAVIIASPDYTHASLVHQCLKLGKPALCEKPLASSAADCKQIVDAEIATEKRLITVGFMRRFDPDYLALKQALNSANTEVLLMHCFHRNATCPDWFTAELTLSNALVHEIDAIRWLLSEEIETVQVFKSKKSPKSNFDDPLLTVLKTASGTIVNAEVFMQAQYGYEIGTELVCADRTIALTRPSFATVKTAGAEILPITDDWTLRFKRAYTDELTNWINAISDNRYIGASAWDGYRAAIVTDSCLASRQTGQIIDISMEETPALYK